jgi:hypothetical protein
LRRLQLKPTKTGQRTEDSLVYLLLPIARLLVRGGIGIDELVYAAKRAYLREAVQVVARQDGRASISRIAVATGMTRKEVTALLRDSPKNKPTAKRRSGQQRALRVLRGWLTDPRFQNRSGRPCELEYGGNERSFALLVKLYGGDVTPKSVLHELERIEVVEFTNAGTLRLRPSRSRSNIELNYKLSDLARMFEDFAFTVVQSSSRPDPPSFFGFRDSGISSPRDAAYFMRRFSRRAAAFLEDFQQWSAARESVKAASHQERSATRVGLGVYLLRSDLQSARNPRGKPADNAEIRRSQKRRG